jgi:hypothetical protein
MVLQFRADGLEHRELRVKQCDPNAALFQNKA